MSKELLHRTLFNLLKSRQAQHCLDTQKMHLIINTITSLNRHQQPTIQQQLRSAIKQLQQQKRNPSPQSQQPTENMFKSYELEWIMNWMIETYYSHLKLIQWFEKETGEEQQKRQQRKEGEEDFVAVDIQVPVFVEPLEKARLVREGGARMNPNGCEVLQE